MAPVSPVRLNPPTIIHIKAVEECAERLTDEDVDALCELVAAHLGGGEASGEAEAAGAAAEGGAMEVSVVVVCFVAGEQASQCMYTHTHSHNDR